MMPSDSMDHRVAQGGEEIYDGWLAGTNLSIVRGQAGMVKLFKWQDLWFG